MANNYGISDAEVNNIKEQQARRIALRKEFLKQSTNPYKHAAEAGYVFDTALQNYNSMKVTHYERFKPNKSNGLFGIATIIVPMLGYGYILWKHRDNREQQIRSGELRYRDRMFKLQ